MKTKKIFVNPIFRNDFVSFLSLQDKAKEFIYKNHRFAATQQLIDWDLEAKVTETVRKNNPYKKRWQYTKPCLNESDHQKIVTTTGRYSGNCTYTKYDYQPFYHSKIQVYRSGKVVKISQGSEKTGDKYEKLVFAPKGLKFLLDNLGIKVVSKDGIDYHPSVAQWKSNCFAKLIRAKLTEKRKKIREQAKIAKENKRFNEIRQREIGSCRVSLNDSRKAGNCVEGSLSFAEKTLKISRSEVLNGGYLFHVAAEKLLKTGNTMAIRACEAAWNRETMVCI